MLLLFLKVDSFIQQSLCLNINLEKGTNLTEMTRFKNNKYKLNVLRPFLVFVESILLKTFFSSL